MKSIYRKNRFVVAAVFLLSAIVISAILLATAGKIDKKIADNSEEPVYDLPDTLRVGVLNSPTTYFDYRGVKLGYDYELLKAFTQDEKIETHIKVAYNFPELMELLHKGEIDLIAAPVPETAEYIDKALTCGPTQTTTQVVVQLKGDGIARDVTELVGRHITVERDSKFEHRLRNLNSELGGGIVIETLAKDTLVSEDMIKLVADKSIEATVVDSDRAKASQGDYPQLDISLPISLEQHSRWAVSPSAENLARVLDRWTEDNKTLQRQLYSKYFSTSKLPAGMDALSGSDLEIVLPKGGGISNFDALFRKASEGSGFDWKMVAAVAYVESRFKTDLVSWAGAKGIMQVMPNTAKALGFPPSSLEDPETCIRAGIKLLGTLDNQLSAKVPDAESRRDFVLAAYNAGLGHVYDAIALADKYGMDSRKWAGAVEEAALMKSRPQYYRDPVVRNGYFRATETIDFVKRVNAAYEKFKTRQAL